MKLLARKYLGFREGSFWAHPRLMAISFHRQSLPGSPTLAVNTL